MFFEIELIERDGYLYLPEQFTEPTHRSSVFETFVAVAEEDLIRHGEARG
jgi:hypothetical protein